MVMISRIISKIREMTGTINKIKVKTTTKTIMINKIMIKMTRTMKTNLAIYQAISNFKRRILTEEMMEPIKTKANNQTRLSFKMKRAKFD